MADRRKQFEKRPLAFLGAAFGAGLAVALLIPNGNGSSRRGWPDPGSEGRAVHGSVVTNRVLQAWEDIKGALVGMAVAQFAELLSEAAAPTNTVEVPGDVAQAWGRLELFF